MITQATSDDFEAITTLWEASVRASHDFLSEDDIVWMRPQLRHEWLGAVTLRVYKDEGVINGFIGVSGSKIEMLFVAPNLRGQGVGTALLNYATSQMGVTLVDVNEQNPLATRFYLKSGFIIIGHSPIDNLGKPYPLLHMARPDDTP